MSIQAVRVRPTTRPLLPELTGAVLAVLCLALGWVSHRYGGHQGILAAEALPSPTHFALLAFGAGATGMFLRHNRVRGALVVSIGTLLAVIGLTLVGQVLGGTYDGGSYRSPDGRLEFRVTKVPSAGELQQSLRLQETHGARSRYWDVGCISGDTGSVRDVHWSSSDKLLLTVDGVQRTLHLGADGPIPNPGLRSC